MADVILYWSFGAWFWMVVALWAWRAMQFMYWLVFDDE